ncbi:hypothetical protein SCT_0099 [Sulfuricella sp. T08]|nr:hypothetical protein SCT_0099 [Sulfuricella sp. T08]
MSTFLLSWRCLGALCTALLIATPVHAAKDPDKEATRRVQAQLRKISDEKVVLEQDKATLNQELDTLKKKSGEMESSASSANKRKAVLEKETEALKQDKTKLSEQVEQLKKELAESQLALRDTRQNLQQETSQKQRLDQSLSTRGKELEVCETKNQKLYQYQVELINRAQNRGSLSALLDSEPVLGLKRVEIENILEEYRDKVDKEYIIQRNQ